MDTILVTGGAGFIGSNFVKMLVRQARYRVVVLDKLTYAGSLDNLPEVRGEGLIFHHGDIGDNELVGPLLSAHRPRYIVNFAAETHVDRSIDGPLRFLQANVVAAVQLLDTVRSYYGGLDSAARERFRLLHISTDEVYGSLGVDDDSSREDSLYAPNSPYSASKAGSDHFVRAYHRTYELPCIIANSSNNYGYCQFPEKFIPKMILSALRAQPMPIFGDGQNVRDWVFVEDHCDALLRVLEKGRVGDKYNIGGNAERRNLQVVETVCAALESALPAADNSATRAKGIKSYSSLPVFVPDRPGHDRRYSTDITKVERELGWRPSHAFEDGIKLTVDWYLAHQEWWEAALARENGSW